MKMITLFCFLFLTFGAQAQLMEKDGELFVITNDQKQIQTLKSSFAGVKKVKVGTEKDGEFTILSDLIFHQDLKVYVVNPVNGKVSRVDLDERSEYYGSVEIVSGLIVRHDNKLYKVNPRNGKTRIVKE